MDVGLLVIRAVVGALMAGHGAQKLLGRAGGGGLNRTGEMFDSIGLRPARAMAAIAGLGELLGGLLFAVGLLTPLAAFALTVVMLNAIATVHWPKGFWSTSGGYEFNLAIIAAAIAIAATGPSTAGLFDESVGGDSGVGALAGEANGSAAPIEETWLA